VRLVFDPRWLSGVMTARPGVDGVLNSWCACESCDMAGSNKDHDRSSRPSAEDR
jgi:hypothetical protein